MTSPLALRCPHCRAAPGAGCVTRYGVPRGVHERRVALAGGTPASRFLGRDTDAQMAAADAHAIKRGVELVPAKAAHGVKAPIRVTVERPIRVTVERPIREKPVHPLRAAYRARAAKREAAAMAEIQS